MTEIRRWPESLTFHTLTLTSASNPSTNQGRLANSKVFDGVDVQIRTVLAA